MLGSFSAILDKILAAFYNSYNEILAVNVMNSIFQIDPNLDIPIYQQLVDKIRISAKMGDLTPGQQLPTVQELAQGLSLARGTIKRAYDELEYQGILEKIQGRGTFVCYQQENPESRKDQAIAAINAMLEQLETMGFSQTEISIFIDLKRRERTNRLSALKIALVECNPEALAQLAEQMRTIQGIELCLYLLKTVEEYPYNLDDDVDLVITTGAHAQYIESILPDKKKLARIALRLSITSLAGIVSLPPDTRVGILSGSLRFGHLILETCRQYGRSLQLQTPCQFTPGLDVMAYLQDKDAVLVPKNYEKYCNTETAQCLYRVEQQGKLVLCDYEMDEGSCLHLKEKLQQLREEKLK